MKSNKGTILILDALLRIVISIILLVIVVKIGERTAEAFSGSNAPKHLDEFASGINEMQNGATKVFLVPLDPDSAIFGFIKENKEMECRGCFNMENKDIGITKSFYRQKPLNNAECKDSACVCVCMEGLKEVPRSEYQTNLECEKFYCKSIKGDIKTEIQTEPYLKANPKIRLYPVLANGFMFERIDTNEYGQSPMATKERNTQVCVTKNADGGNLVTAVYPGTDCLFLNQNFEGFERGKSGGAGSSAR